MKVNRQDFLRVIQKVAPLIKSRNTIPILSTVRLEGLNGRFHAMASDCDSFMEAICLCEGNLMPCCVSAGPLLALSGYGPDVIGLNLDQNRLEVASGSVARLSVLDSVEYPKPPSENLKELGINTLDLVAVIRAVAWAADHNPRSMAGISQRAVFVQMDTKKHEMMAVALDGKRLGLIRKTLVVPNCKLMFMAEHAETLCDVLSGEGSAIKSSDDWIVATNNTGLCAIKRTIEFKPPIERMKEIMDSATVGGDISKEGTLSALVAMQSVANGDPFVYADGRFLSNGFAIDYRGTTNEFHSVIPAVPKANPNPRPSDTDQSPNVAGAEQEVGPSAKIPDFRFDAALLHNVLKHTPADTIKCTIASGNAFFHAGDVITALALIRNQ